MNWPAGGWELRRRWFLQTNGNTRTGRSFTPLFPAHANFSRSTYNWGAGIWRGCRLSWNYYKTIERVDTVPSDQTGVVDFLPLETFDGFNRTVALLLGFVIMTSRNNSRILCIPIFLLLEGFENFFPNLICLAPGLAHPRLLFLGTNFNWPDFGGRWNAIVSNWKNVKLNVHSQLKWSLLSPLQWNWSKIGADPIDSRISLNNRLHFIHTKAGSMQEVQISILPRRITLSFRLLHH